MAPIYLDNHATTCVDPRVVAAMLPYWTTAYGNAGSVIHRFGTDARAAVERAREQVAAALHAHDPQEIVFTSGATESNNLALRGMAERLQRRGRHVVSVATEHRAVLDPLARLRRQGFEVDLLAVQPATAGAAWGQVDGEQFAARLRDDTILVSVMLANNETGVLQPLAELGALCRARGIPLHCDATQAVGKLPIDVQAMPVDLLSFSAHKFHGPKGIGGLYIRRQTPPLRPIPLLEGGGQERGLRSGTLPVPLIVGLGEAIHWAEAERDEVTPRVLRQRNHLWDLLRRRMPDCTLNGPPLDPDSPVRDRLPNNLNVQFAGVDGETLMLHAPELAVSAGSACTAAQPEPSHVLLAMGLSPDAVHSSLRFGLSRFTTDEEVAQAADMLAAAVGQIRSY